MPGAPKRKPPGSYQRALISITTSCCPLHYPGYGRSPFLKNDVPYRLYVTHFKVATIVVIADAPGPQFN